jgi:hypothetical protein
MYLTESAILDGHKSNPEQVMLQHALERQKKHRAYTDLLSKSPNDKDLFGFLISRKKTLKVMEAILKMVNRPNDWVESAEFGIREEY